MKYILVTIIWSKIRMHSFWFLLFVLKVFSQSFRALLGSYIIGTVKFQYLTVIPWK